MDKVMKQKNMKHRDSNFELLRCLAMMFVIAAHFCVHGIRISSESLSIQNFVLHSIRIYFGSLGNYLFMLLSGYFLSMSVFSVKKIFNLCLQLMFYSIPTAIILYHFGLLSVKDVVLSFFPFLTGVNWYASYYLVFFLFIPYLNKLLKELNREELLKITIITFIFGVFITNAPFIKFFTPGLIFQFFMMYFAANYIRLYCPEILQNRKILSVLLVAIFVLTEVIILLDNFIINKSILVSLMSKFYFLKHSFYYLLAIIIFCIFRTISLDYSRIINFLASGTFGIYIFHDNNYIRPFLWDDILKTKQLMESQNIIFYMISSVFIIFVIGTLIDFLRRSLFLFIQEKLNFINRIQ